MKISTTEPASTTEATPPTKKSWFNKVKNTLHVIAKAVILAPIKLPAKIKLGAQYLAILLGILDTLEESDEDDFKNSSSVDGDPTDGNVATSGSSAEENPAVSNSIDGSSAEENPADGNAATSGSSVNGSSAEENPADGNAATSGSFFDKSSAIGISAAGNSSFNKGSAVGNSAMSKSAGGGSGKEVSNE